MQDVWAKAPAPAFHVWLERGQPVWQVNPAAHVWAAARRWDEAAWGTLARAVAVDCQGGRLHGAVPTLGVQWIGAALTPGWLAWLQSPDADAEAAQVDALREEIQHLRERLDMAQAAGRLGVWERDAATGQGHWDANVFRIFGMDPSQGTPSFDQAVARYILPEDATRVRDRFRHSVSVPGRHDVHYRVVRPDGDVSFIHSIWEVRDGPDPAARRIVGVMVDDTEAVRLARLHAASRQHLDLIADLVGVSVWRHDLASGRLHFNRPGYEMSGIQPQDQGIALELMRSRVHPDDLHIVMQAYERALVESGPVDAEARYRNRNGEYRTLLTRRLVERDAQGALAAMLGVSIDVTEQATHRAHAQTLADRLSLITDATGIGVWSMELATQRLVWNAQMFRIYGLAAHEPVPLASEVVQRWTHRDDRARLQQGLARLFGGAGALDELEFRIVRDDGSVRWVVGRACVVTRDDNPAAFGVVIDETDRHLAQAALVDARSRATVAMLAAGMGTWERDCRTGLAVWDAQMYRLRGLAPDDGRSPEEIMQALYGKPRLPELEAKVEQLMAQPGEALYENEFSVPWPDGSTRWLASRGMLVRDEHGQPLRFLGVNWDITDLKLGEQAQRDKAAAEEASRAKTEFLARVSHELRTPLNGVLGFTELMLGDTVVPLPALHRQRAVQVLSAARHLLALIDDLLELTGVESGGARQADQVVALAPVVDDAVKWVAPLAAQYGVEVAAAPIQGSVRGDPRRLRQVVVNLLSNAVKYNRPGGRVDVAALHDADAARAGLSVRDTGRGLSQRQLSRLFEPFNRLGAEREGIEGTGIGLSIVRHLIDQMGGHIEVDSTQGQGSEFRVWLLAAPAAPAAADQDASRALPVAPAVTDAAQRLLYIEDNPVNVLLVRELMALRPGVQLDVAEDGATGLRMALDLQPAVVLVDMQLPDMSGADVVRSLRKEPTLAHTRFVALSASAMPQDIAASRGLGFTAYWTKPIDLHAFLGELDKLLASVGREV